MLNEEFDLTCCLIQKIDTSSNNKFKKCYMSRPLPELKPKKPIPFWTKFALMSAVVFFILSMEGYGLFKNFILGYFFDAGIGFISGGAIGKILQNISDLFDNERKEQKIRALHQKAEEKYHKKDYHGAIGEYESALNIDHTNSSTYFNIACLYSQLKNEDKSFHYLSYAAKYKYGNLKEKVMSNPNLGFVRHSLKYDDFMKKIAN
jgi:tetratricopeptide (TPR) repeat protein